MKWLKRILFSIVALVTLIALAIAFENWRGKRAWLKFKTAWEAKGESFDVASVIPPKVPDHENFAMTPFLAPLFDYEYAPSLVFKNSNAVRRIESVSLGSKSGMPKMGGRNAGTRTDLKEWQDYFGAHVLLALSEHDKVMEELRSASSRPHSHYPVHYHESFSAQVRHLPVLRNLSDVARLRVLAQLESGQTNEAFADLELAIRLGESLKSEPLLVSQLSRLALLELALDVAWETLDRWSDTQLAELQRTLSEIDVLEDYPKSLRGERAFANDVFLRMNSGEFFPGELAFVARYGPRGFLYQNQLTINRLHLKYSLAAVDVEARRVDARKALTLDELPELKGRHPYRIFARLLFPALSKAVLRFAKTQTHLDFAVTACALEHYRRANGSYPERLEQLVPTFADKIPHDLVSGAPLRYVRNSNDDFVLYAVAFDGKDNSGTPGRANNQGAADGGYDWVWKPAPKRNVSSTNR
jgi:hypothetical protein